MFSRFQKKEEKSVAVSVREANLIAENTELKKKISEFLLENANLKSRLEKTLIDVGIGDPAPTDAGKRKDFVAKVAELQKDILGPKIKQMISSAQALLSESSNDREFDQALKGGIYMLWEIYRWGELMINEQISNQTGQNPSSEDEQLIKQ